MKILILGAGRVGESVAESLVSEQNDITVIDTDPQRLALLQDRMDLRGVVGNGIQPSVLRDAGAEDADMLIACAPLDETNLVACKIAHHCLDYSLKPAPPAAWHADAGRGDHVAQRHRARQGLRSWNDVLQPPGPIWRG